MVLIRSARQVWQEWATWLLRAVLHSLAIALSVGLWDAAMIKDNHVAVAGDIGEAVRRAKQAGIARIIVEVDSTDPIEPGLAAGAAHLAPANKEPPTARGTRDLLGGAGPRAASGGPRARGESLHGHARELRLARRRGDTGDARGLPLSGGGSPPYRGRRRCPRVGQAS